MDVTVTRNGAVAVIVFSNGAVNALSTRAGLVQALSAELKQVEADASVKAIVLQGAGRGFSAGADIADFNDDPEKDVGPLRHLVEQLDAIAKPTVAAVHGFAFGGGLEFALAARRRIASPDAKFAFPEVNLGLLPGAGGTQRLPRLSGPKRALEIMLSGKPITAAQALQDKVVDQVVEGDLLAQAVALALSLADAADLPPRARDHDTPTGGLQEALAAARAAVGKGAGSLAARQHIIACVEAAALPFDQGMDIEYRLFSELMLSEASKGLRHAFLGERAVAKIPGLSSDVKPKAITSSAVIGAGTMGSGIAVCLLKADIPVVLIEQKQEALDRGLGAIRKIFQGDVDKGRITQDKADTRLARLTGALDIAAAAEADIIIEAVFESLDVKRQIFERLDAVAKPEAILASNTSTLDLNAIANFTKRPQQVVGAHFFSPAHIMRLLEVIRGDKTDPQVLVTTLALAKTLGKVGVVAGVCNGFIGNRIFEEYLRQAYFLLDEGALPQQVDGALERWGMAMGPLRTMDLVGGDIGWSIRKQRAIDQPDRPYSRLADAICEEGRFGQKTGSGWYKYTPGSRAAEPDSYIEAKLAEHTRSLGLTPRQISDEEIVSRCLLAMVNEGAKILDEKIAYRPVDIDIIYLNGYGFPAERGGPMLQADLIGLPDVLQTIEGYHQGYQGWAFEPSPLLIDLVSRGADFASLNG